MFQELRKLRVFCESFQYGGPEERLPYCFTLLTTFIANRGSLEFVEEGMHEYEDMKVTLKIYIYTLSPTFAIAT